MEKGHGNEATDCTVKQTQKHTFYIMPILNMHYGGLSSHKA